MDAQLAMPFEAGRPNCTIYLDLTRDDIKDLKEAMDGQGWFYSDGSTYIELDDETKKTLIPLLQAIITEAEKEIP